MNFISGDTMQPGTLTGISPSFTAHSSNNLADVAARVVEEFRHENGGEYDDIFNSNDSGYSYGNDNSEFSVTADANADTGIRPHPEKMKHENERNDDDNDNDNDDEFEFAIVCNYVNPSSITADEMFSQGHIVPRYPLFDQSLLLDVDPDRTKTVNKSTETEAEAVAVADGKPSLTAVRLPLRKLFSEDRDFCSSSSSEGDDLDGIASGTYCVWKPKIQSPEMRKKSNSTGNLSHRWKFRDILYRSHSDSKESPFLFFKHSITTSKKIKNEHVKKKKVVNRATVGDGAPAVATEKKDPAADRRQPYLPSGQALATAFNTVSRSNRNLLLF